MNARLLFAAAVAAVSLTGCAARVSPPIAAPTSVVDVQILALNDFHGNVERPPDPVRFQLGTDTFATAEAGGAAIVGQELTNLRFGHTYTITVAAGDLIGASPLTSAYFLDEPTIEAMEEVGVEYNAVGNHEFDKGWAELVRMQRGGCDRHTTKQPCKLEPFDGADFKFLAANVIMPQGGTLFPGTAIKDFGPVQVGIIGMTLTETKTLVTPAGVAGLTFADEAATANAAIPALKAAGADAIVLLIHQGGRVPSSYHLQDCDGLSGDILPLLDKLDPAIATVISGHTHNAYACELDRGGAKRLLTSAGKYGYFVSDLRLAFDPGTLRLLAQHARNVPMIRDGVGNPAIAALVKRYADAAAPAAARVVGRLSAPAPRAESDAESPAANLIADAQLAATRAADRGGAQISFINVSGVRAGLTPNARGEVTYGSIFAMQPFGNNLVVKTLTGAQLKTLLEQQFKLENGAAKVSSLLVPSAGFRFSYDLKQPEGRRITAMTLDGRPIDPNGRYRIVVNNFLASGGDGFSVLNDGTDAFDAGLDLDALEAWLATNPPVPAVGRITSASSP
jgi:5'-nucleotidase